jgi:molybdopterin synthase catalytic subunit
MPIEDTAASVAEAGVVAVVRGAIDTARLLAEVADVGAGGNVLFVGTVRGVTAGAVTRSLTYDAHEPLAIATLATLRREAVARFDLTACGIVHRLGPVAPGEAGVAIAASAPHRRAAFAATEWLLDRLKRDVPIWKCEEDAGGGRAWVHPATAPRPGAEA